MKDLGLQKYDVIIGRNYTDLPQLAYCRYHNKFEFVNRDDFPFKSYPEVESRKQSLELPVVSESINIPSASINFINVKVNNTEMFLPYENSSDDVIKLEKGDTLNTSVTVNNIVPEIKPCLREINKNDLAEGLPLTCEQYDELLTLINRYRMCVALDLSELGCTHLIEMDIVEKPGTEPPHAKLYSTNTEQRDKIKSRVAEWKKNKLATETSATYASPCILIEKPDGTFRLVVDYRKLNANTVRLSFPLPNVDDGMEELNGAAIFASLDLAQGYLQIPLTERAKEKTGFITQDETGQFERAIFGLMNAPFYFAKLMKIIFGPYGNKLALTYFDDILVHAKSWEELLVK